MSTTTPRTREPAPSNAPGSEGRVVLRGVGRALFEAIAARRGGGSVPRLTWIDGDLELMSPSTLHEVLARRLGLFVTIVAAALGMRPRDVGSMTLRRGRRRHGKEADTAFYLANSDQVRDVEQIDLGVHPPPDLAIEVEITSPLLAGERVYARLGVPELWRHDGQALRFYRLAGRRYAEQDESVVLPHLRPDEVLHWVGQYDAMEIRDWIMAVDAWARQDLANRPG